ncbi:MAG TPA: hypothetical protein VJ836_03300 [Candidatus Saccharimonadales bacterium]|nr:hypothetical protein [Candidatus Saccharimonadales bacterium]
MIGWIALAVVVAILAGAAGWFLWWWRRPVQLKVDYFQEQWKELQKRLRDKTNWPEAIIKADQLLDQALRKKRISGRNMGERLVKAQRLFTDNDGVWFGHKLRGQVEHDPAFKLKESDVKQALVGIRQALKDVGALQNDKR